MSDPQPESESDTAFSDWCEHFGDLINHWWPGCIQGPEDYYDERIRAAFGAGFSAGIRHEKEAHE